MPGPPTRESRDDREDEPEKDPHAKQAKTFARVFVNEIGLNQIYKDRPVFPVGSVIVREKLLTKNDEVPQLVTVMLKHDKGFSPKSNDWQFFVLDPSLSKISKSEKTGSCSKCHAQASGSDWVFKTYLK